MPPEQPGSSGPGPRLTPAQERAVRDLLADARHDEAMPADVAGRLDATLADLVAARETTGDPTSSAASSVTPLAARRRRRRVAGALVAAAAVVVGGVALGQVVPDSPFPTAGGGDAGSAADESFPLEGAPGSTRSQLRDRDRERATMDSLEGKDDKDGKDAESPAELRENSRESAPLMLSYAVLEIDPDHFTRDVRRAVEQTRPDVLLGETYDPQTGALGGALSGAHGGRPACRVGEVGHGRRVHVRYDGEPALLVLRRADGLLRRVDLYACGASEPLRTTYLLSR